jgi:hypothetical protein
VSEAVLLEISRFNYELQIKTGGLSSDLTIPYRQEWCMYQISGTDSVLLKLSNLLQSWQPAAAMFMAQSTVVLYLLLH